MNNNVYNKERYKGWGDAGTKAMRRLTKEPVERSSTRSKKKFPCKRNKGEHTFVDRLLPDSRHRFLTNEWYRMSANANYEIRWRLFVCSACGKEDIKHEERPYNPTNA